MQLGVWGFLVGGDFGWCPTLGCSVLDSRKMFCFIAESKARPPFEGGPPPHLPPFERHGRGFLTLTGSDTGNDNGQQFQCARCRAGGCTVPWCFEVLWGRDPPSLMGSVCL